MNSIRKYFAAAPGVAGALLLAPVVTLFGLTMLGLAIGLSLIAAGAAAGWAGTAGQDFAFEAAAEPVDETDAGVHQTA